jgi:formamidopyrimidine-DNA glycosylase
MPELPEVETVRRGLAPVMEGRRILTAEVRRPDLRWPLPEGMGARLAGARVLRLGRRSKYLLADLDTGETWLVHLGMSGRMLVSGRVLGDFVQDHPAASAHDHVVVEMEGGARITFNDPRRFGAMDLIPTPEVEGHKLRRRTPMKAALLDQGVVAGLGNIYVCEALYRAGLSPVRRAHRVAARRLAALVPAIRAVLMDAIAAGGSSLRDYRQADGELGYFQHTFDVYGREGAPCRREGCGGTVRRIVQSGRSSFYCPACQT